MKSPLLFWKIDSENFPNIQEHREDAKINNVKFYKTLLNIGEAVLEILDNEVTIGDVTKMKKF